MSTFAAGLVTALYGLTTMQSCPDMENIDLPLDAGCYGSQMGPWKQSVCPTNDHAAPWSTVTQLRCKRVVIPKPASCFTAARDLGLLKLRVGKRDCLWTSVRKGTRLCSHDPGCAEEDDLEDGVPRAPESISHAIECPSTCTASKRGDVLRRAVTQKKGKKGGSGCTGSSPCGDISQFDNTCGAGQAQSGPTIICACSTNNNPNTWSTELGGSPALTCDKLGSSYADSGNSKCYTATADFAVLVLKAGRDDMVWEDVSLGTQICTSDTGGNNKNISHIKRCFCPGSSESPTSSTSAPTTDSGSNDTDSGSNDTDSGSNDTDSGSNDTDSGSNDTDSGSNDTDSGSNDTDSGSNDSSTDSPTTSTDSPTGSTDSPTGSTNSPTDGPIPCVEQTDIISLVWKNESGGADLSAGISVVQLTGAGDTYPWMSGGGTAHDIGFPDGTTKAGGYLENGKMFVFHDQNQPTGSACLPPSSEICITCHSQTCGVYIFQWHEPPGSSQSNGGFPSSLTQELGPDNQPLWRPGGYCAPKFWEQTIMCKHRMLALRRTLDCDETVCINGDHNTSIQYFTIAATRTYDCGDNTRQQSESACTTAEAGHANTCKWTTNVAGRKAHKLTPSGTCSENWCPPIPINPTTPLVCPVPDLDCTPGDD